MILNDIKQVEVFLGAVVNTNQLQFTASYTDRTKIQGTEFSDDVDGVTADTAVVIMVLPSNNDDRRTVKGWSIYNSDTTSQLVTVQARNLTTSNVSILVSVTLNVGDTLFYTNEEGYKVMDSGGGLKMSSASLGGGTVTNFSSGNLHPLFDSHVAGSTTTPSQTFTQISKSANLVFASPDGAPGLPDFRPLMSADLPPATAGVVPIVAQATITAFDPVTSDGFVADSTNIFHKNKIAGIALTNIAIGFSGDIVATGKITNPAWAWTIGPPVYLNGVSLSQSPPVTGIDAFSLIIGLATGTDTIDVDIKQAFQF